MALKLASLFSEHMVLQQGVAVPVWGWASPGEEVTVTFTPGAGSGDAKQSISAKAGADGRWQAALKPLKASSAPGRLAVRAEGGGGECAVGDVLVGEVWLASGQSNMQWRVRDSVDGAAEVAAANYPLIRLFSVPNLVNEPPPVDVRAAWAVCSPESAAEFSAVAYFFGRELQRDFKVPIGLINSSWGGTRVETWTRREVLEADESFGAELAEYEKALRAIPRAERLAAMAEQQADPDGWLRKHVPADPGNQGAGRGWARAEFDDSAWPEMELPAIWQARGVRGNGVVWFRLALEVPADWAGRDLALGIGACDKHDITYWNGEQVGATGWETRDAWTTSRKYRVPGKLVRAGRNVLAVRVYSYRNGGGITGPSADMKVAPAAGAGAGKPLLLVGNWRYQVEHDFGVVNDASISPWLVPNCNSPHALWDNMMLPLVPYALAGFIWYQGESNASNAADYRRRFPAMIRDWRRAWGGKPRPFLFVQLANYVSVGTWAGLREAQTMALAEPATGMAVAIDIGDPEDIHPRNKQEVGRRLALAAEHVAYGKELVYSGPLYRSHNVEGAAIRVKFDHVGGGLKAKGGESLKGFTLAGADRKFAAAEARIDGSDVVVSVQGVTKPAAVRYAWTDNPTCNLYNKEGLPASPFRTDAW
ncbi:MAG TPA: sialate O-acetylesterase [Planctomycetota bacterium]|nr:sialate O-acetylesterase [Planctomycetota bacterium]